jgi:hypothetical protein
MFVAKPHKKGAPVALDGSDKDAEVQDLASLSGAELIPMQDPGPFANPDGANAAPSAYVDFMGGYPQGNLRSGNVSGRGTLQKTAKTTAPMTNPFPRA